jgi:hypothetical protein
MADIIYPIKATSLDDLTKKLLSVIVRHLHETDFLFTVEAKGHHWDVYRANVNDKDVAIYLRMTPEKKVELGMCPNQDQARVVEVIERDW